MQYIVYIYLKECLVCQMLIFKKSMLSGYDCNILYIHLKECLVVCRMLS